MSTPVTHVLFEDERWLEVYNEKQRAFLTAFSETPSIPEAAVKSGVTSYQVARWRKHDAEFEKHFQDAKKLGIEYAEHVAWKRSLDGVDEPVYQGGQLVGTKRAYSNALLMFMLKGAAPEKYRDRVEHSGPDGGPIEVVTEVRRVVVPVQVDTEPLLNK